MEAGMPIRISIDATVISIIIAHLMVCRAARGRTGSGDGFLCCATDSITLSSKEAKQLISFCWTKRLLCANSKSAGRNRSQELIVTMQCALSVLLRDTTEFLLFCLFESCRPSKQFKQFSFQIKTSYTYRM